MIAAAFVFLLAALAAGAVLKAIDERRMRKHYQAEAEHQRQTAAFYANAYAEARWPRTRSAVSESREGAASWCAIDELTGPRR